MVLFFVPEHTLPFEKLRARRDAPELWAEVTIPHKGPPRPIRLAVKKDGKMEADRGQLRFVPSEKIDPVSHKPTHVGMKPANLA